MNPQRTLLLAGLGNTGSHLAPLIARMGLANLLVLADPDIVEAGNMTAQNYGPEDVGLSKVDAMAKHLIGLNKDLKIECFVGDLEDLPLGYFSDTVVLCVDHDAARQVGAENAWMMGGTLFDVAVNGQAGLARVTRIFRETGRACLQCSWPPEQYDKLQIRHSCRKTAPTHAPAALGAFAASLAALQIQSPTPDASNTEIIASPGAVEMWISKHLENDGCRFRHHHQAPPVECLNPFDFSVPFGSLFAQLGTSSIEIPGFTFVGRGRCAGCGIDDEILLLDRRARRACARCGGPLEFLPFHARASVRPEDFTHPELSQSLATVGLRRGDVLRTDSNRWMQLGELHISHEVFTPTSS